MKEIKTPISDEIVESLAVGDMVLLSGNIYCGRDAVLPRIISDAESILLKELKGSVIFHTAVSRAGIGPTSSNKLEIESSIIPLAQIGVKIHLGKGKISQNTIKELDQYNSIYAVSAPVTALLKKKTKSQELIAYSELGMEAFYRLNVEQFPIIIAAAHGRSIFDDEF